MEATVTVADAVVTIIPDNVRPVVEVSEEITVINIGNMGPQGPRGSQVLSGEGEPSPVIGLVGDQYIQTGIGKIFGPKTAQGWGQGVSLIEAGTELGQVYTQTNPSSMWTIIHTLDFVPNVVIVDSEQTVVEGSITYSAEPPYTITAVFSQAIAGKAYLS